MYEIPLFPLNTVLFPGMPLRLHIFEERYLEMMKRVLATNHTFGVILIKHGEEAGGPNPEPYLVGCTARVVQVEQLEDGRLNITAVGDERFRVMKIGYAQPYLTAFAQAAPLLSTHSMEVVKEMPALRRHLMQYLRLLAEYASLNSEVPTTGIESIPGESEPEEATEEQVDLSQLQLPEDPIMLIYLAASLLQVPAVEKQPLLESDTLSGTLKGLQRLFRRELAIMPTLMNTSAEDASMAALVN